MMHGPIITFDAVMREPLPPIDWLVEGVLANGDRAVFFAEFGAFKTWSLLDLGLHIVDVRFGRAIAADIAHRLEYQGTGWLFNVW